MVLPEVLCAMVLAGEAVVTFPHTSRLRAIDCRDSMLGAQVSLNICLARE